jgi:curved DNA-binding protein CbpA
MPPRNSYTILSIAQNAPQAAIKKAFRAGAIKHHPDRNHGSEVATARFIEIQEAFAELSDPVRRAALDEELQRLANLDRIMEGIFGPRKTGEKKQRANPRPAASSSASRPKSTRPSKAPRAAAPTPRRAPPRPADPPRVERPSNYMIQAIQKNGHLPVGKQILWAALGFAADFLEGMARSR